MAFSRKNKRRITVDAQEYFWLASGNDGWINLFVMVDIDGGQKLSCAFYYHHDETPFDGGVSLSNQFVITPYTVRQVIEYGLTQGWQPLKSTSDILELGHVDDKIDLRLSRNKEHAIKGMQQADGGNGAVADCNP